ncbi:MAG TPA: dephospho-CoA kinase [Bacteroidales bacterium]|jgi:dephospho-CoA kinase|nr:dephospho-CoA kinase [Bacteroidales bacterium]
MIKVGITGGIGSGKSVACRIFSILGVPVYNADAEAKTLTNTDPEIREQLISLAGEAVFTDQSLNRRYLSDLIFNNNELLARVNRIIHPRVEAHFIEWALLHSGSPYLILESAILFESNLYIHFDKIVTVTAPEDIRIRRALTRNNMTVEKIRSIMDSQLPEKEITEKSDYIVINDEKELIIPQILRLHQLFLTNR